MVVIAAAVCTSSGRTLISRQFVDIARSRVEGLLASFPKLVSSEQEHTFIETENVRYVYQPLENLFVLLITNKSSNIMEDLETLHLLAKLVPDCCGSLDVSQILKNSFELIFAIDEVIVGGYKEKVTLSQIKTLTEMDSHEERIHEIVERNKAREAAEQAKLKIKEIELQKKAGGKFSGISSSNYSGGYSGQSSFSKEPSIQKSEPKSDSYRGASSAPKKGMQLKSKTGGQSDVLKALKEAGEITDTPAKSVPGAPVAATSNPAQKKDNVHVEVEEILSLAINQDGGVEELDVRGSVKLEILQPEYAHVSLKLDNIPKDLQSQTHPTLDKVKFAKESILTLKDSSKTFPTKTSLGLLKWRYASTNENDIPLSVTCWPTPGGEMTTVNLEYNLLKTHLELQDVQINIPIPDGHNPVVDSADGSYDFQARASILSWKIPLINAENKEGTMEFSIPYRGDSSGFFPVGIKFQSSTLFTGIEIASVNKIADGSAVKFSSVVSFAPKPDGFQLQWA